MKIFNRKLQYPILGTVLTAVLFLSGCKKEALQKDPSDKINTEVVFASTENAYSAINGMHRLMYSQWYSNQER